MEAYSVGELNDIIKRTLEGEFLLKNCIVEGVISNLKKHYSTGHYYFSLIDDTGSIDMALWRGKAQQRGLVDTLENGVLVQVRGNVSYYSKTGRISVICEDIKVGTKSSYQIAYEKLKQELLALGYFDEKYKKPLPPLPSCIGVVTSASGAVIHDILHVAKQRNPLVSFKVFNVPVQGDSAGPIIAKGIALADADPDVDLIIVGRGGGSMEDLWCFNDRTLVESIFYCHTPVVSAVGHEVDYTLCDFVSDKRGATPSHAAELSIYPLDELKEEVAQKLDFIENTIRYRIQKERQLLFSISNRSITMPALTLLHQQHTILQRFEHTLHSQIQKRLQEENSRLGMLATQLEGKNPLSKVIKGFAKVDVHNEPLQSIQHVHIGDTIEVHIQDGSIKATVQEVIERG